MAEAKLYAVYYVAREMDAAVAFFRDVLGLKLKFQDERRWAQFDTGGARFSLSSTEEAAPGTVGATVVFEVDDAAAVAEAVERAGGRVLQSRDMGAHGRTVSCSDPSGNLIQLFQRAAA